MYDKLVAKVNNIDASDFVLKTKHSTDKTELKKRIPDISNLVKKTDYNTKITELENKIPDISNLATKAALTTVENKIPIISNLATKTAITAVENKIPSISSLVKKTDYNTKITDIENKLNNYNHDKFIDTSKFNTLAANVFNERLAQANIMTKTDFDAKQSSLNRKITANKTRHFLNDNDLCYYRSKQYFDEGSGKQNYLVFLPINKYSKLNSVVDAADYVLSWQPKGLSDESIKPATTFDNNLNPELNYYGTKTRVRFTGSYLK